MNNSVGFPGILKGALLTRSKKISDQMAIEAATSLARFAEKRGITPDNIIATMEETDVFPHEAADVAVQSVKEGLARVEMSWDDVYNRTMQDIKYSRGLVARMIEDGYIKEPDQKLINAAFDWALKEVERR